MGLEQCSISSTTKATPQRLLWALLTHSGTAATPQHHLQCRLQHLHLLALHQLQHRLQCLLLFLHHRQCHQLPAPFRRQLQHQLRCLLPFPRHLRCHHQLQLRLATSETTCSAREVVVHTAQDHSAVPMAARAHQLLLISQAAPRRRSRIALARDCRNLSNVQGHQSQPGKKPFLTTAKLSQPFSIDKPIEHCFSICLLWHFGA